MSVKDRFLLPSLIAALGLILVDRVKAQTFTTLHDFTALSIPGPSTKSDGAYPYAGLILSGDTLFGTASSGGGSGNGTVFAVNADGTGSRTCMILRRSLDLILPTATELIRVPH